MTRRTSGTGSRGHTLAADQAREAAQRFLQANVSGFSADRQCVVQEAVSHLDGDALRLPRRCRDVEEAPSGAEPGGTPPVGVRTLPGPAPRRRPALPARTSMPRRWRRA